MTSGDASKREEKRREHFSIAFGFRRVNKITVTCSASRTICVTLNGRAAPERLSNITLNPVMCSTLFLTSLGRSVKAEGRSYDVFTLSSSCGDIYQCENASSCVLFISKWNRETYCTEWCDVILVAHSAVVMINLNGPNAFIGSRHFTPKHQTSVTTPCLCSAFTAQPILHKLNWRLEITQLLFN